MKLKLENLCTIISMGAYHILYLIFLHLPMTFILTKQDKPHAYVLSSVLLKDLRTVCLCKGPIVRILEYKSTYYSK